MTGTTLAIGILIARPASAAYGKRQTKFVPLLAGMALCVYPYFVDSALWLVVIGAVLLAAPFVIDF
jgi:predicted cobalt transporter CbtA